MQTLHRPAPRIPACPLYVVVAPLQRVSTATPNHVRISGPEPAHLLAALSAFPFDVRSVTLAPVFVPAFAVYSRHVRPPAKTDGRAGARREPPPGIAADQDEP